MFTESPATFSVRGVELNYRFCSLWRIIRVDTTTLYFTDADHPIIQDGLTYTPIGGISVSARQLKEGLQQNNQEVMGLVTAGVITSDDLRAGLYNGARVEVDVVDWMYPWGVTFLTSIYWIVQVTEITNDHWTAQVEGISGRLQRGAGRIYSRTCDAEYGDSRCGLTPITYTGTVVSSSNQVRILSDCTAADDVLNGGKLEWLTGDNVGTEPITIRKNYNTDGRIDLYILTPRNITPGDTFRVTEGCDGRFTTCRDRFSNAVNFRGFPTIAGSLRVARPKN